MSASSSIANAQQQSPKKNSLFRREALDHHLTRELEIDGQVLRVVPPWSWTLFWMLVAIVASAVVVSFVAEVELTSRGKGVLRAPGGVRTLQTQVGGVVTEVSAKSGQSVHVGEPLVKLESAGVQAALLEADRQLELVRSNLKSFTTKQEEIHRTRTALLRSHAELLKQRVASQENTIARLEAKVGSYNALNDKGMVGAIARDEVVEELDRARRQRIELDESLSQTSLELATLNSAHQSELWKAEQQIQEAETKRTALAFSLQQTLIQAPQDGYVEAVLVRAGDVITAGAPVGKLISTGAAKHVVAFLPEKDRAFVEIGSRVRLEVDQLPYSEFGALSGRIARISSDLASPYELREAFGEGAQLPSPSYRVEMSVVDDDNLRRLSPRIRPGMLVTARFTLRRRTLVALVLDPLRRWLR